MSVVRQDHDPVLSFAVCAIPEVYREAGSRSLTLSSTKAASSLLFLSMEMKLSMTLAYISNVNARKEVDDAASDTSKEV